MRALWCDGKSGDDACGCIPNFFALEWHWQERPHWNTLIETTEPIIQNGTIQVPDMPSIGAELN